jgi:hypothetical protein
MKKLSFVCVAALFAASTVFVGCNKDIDNPFDVFDVPTVAVKATYGSNINKDIADNDVIEAESGTDLTFTIRFNKGADNLSEVHLKSTIAGKEYKVLDSVGLDKGLFNKGETYVDFTYKTSVGNVQEVLNFSTKDTKSRTGSFGLTIKPTEKKEVVSGFKISEATLLGGQSHATVGSFYSVALGKVLTVGAATSQSAVVDFAYFYGTNNKATIAAPSDADGQTISYGKVKTSSWSTKNDTKFVILDAAGITPEIESLAGNWDQAIAALSGPTTSKAAQLKAGSVVAFQTAGGIKALFVVTEVSGDAKGSISIILIEKK